MLFRSRLHYDMPKEYDIMKVYYEFVHTQRNDTSHKAPVIENKDVKPGIHMTMAMYLYSTMITITDMEMSGIIDGTPHIGPHVEAPSYNSDYSKAFEASQVGYDMAAEAGPEDD